MPDANPSIAQMLGKILQDRIQAAIQKRMPPMGDPTRGMDDAPVIAPPPAAPDQPFRPKFGGNSVVIPLPTNRGSTFEGYADFGFNGLKPKFNGAGIRYRYDF